MKTFEGRNLLSSNVAAMDEKKMKIKYGCHRLVILIGKYAIKVPNFRYGLEWFCKGIIANISENRIWKIHNVIGSEENKNVGYLCPIVFGSGFILVQRRCQQVETHPDEQTLKEILYYVGDHKIDNYGIYKGRLVMFDYAL